jgi:hypothetical protein
MPTFNPRGIVFVSGGVWCSAIGHRWAEPLFTMLTQNEPKVAKKKMEMWNVKCELLKYEQIFPSFLKYRHGVRGKFYSTLTPPVQMVRSCDYA